MRVVDPMCGYGSVPRDLGRLGFTVTGAEISEQRFRIAQVEAPGQRIIHGNCLEVLSAQGQYDAAFGALPWDWFISPQTANEVDKRIPEFLYQLIRPGGMLILDSTYRVVRAGQVLAVSTVQAAFLAGHGFALTDILEFVYTGHTYEADTSLVLGFTK